MPSFNSVNGVWKPAHEKSVNIKTGEIHDGPDREAVKDIKAAGGQIGKDVEKDVEMIMRAKQMSMTVKEMMELNAPPQEVLDQLNEKKKNHVVDQNKDPRSNAKPGVQPVGGGQDTSGQGRGRAGGFGEQPPV